MKCHAARILVSAPSSNTGKTTFACALMRALMRRGLRVQACKSGPDYIDPMFHTHVVGAPSRNLDLFFADEGLVRRLVGEGARDADITVIEGAMGFYDGIAASSEASSWALARATDTPVLLVVNARGKARSVAAEILGFLQLEKEHHIAAVVLNRVSPMFYPKLKQLIEKECGVPVLGYVSQDAALSLSSRHLGLVTADEVEGLREKLDHVADLLEQSVDLDALVEIAQSAPELSFEREALPELELPVTPRIAVARDAAFCFYYEDALRLLRRLGAELVSFSPLSDAALPDGVGGLFLGGGYPELHADALEANTSMRTSIARAVRDGMPTIAECGGFMYLHEEMEDDEGVAHDMVGAIAGRSFKTGKLGRFGYVELTSAPDNLLASAGEVLRAHEFHYWDSTDAGNAFHARKPLSGRAWDCVHASAALYAGYPHLYLPAHPLAAARFVAASARYAADRTCGV